MNKLSTRKERLNISDFKHEDFDFYNFPKSRKVTDLASCFPDEKTFEVINCCGQLGPLSKEQGRQLIKDVYDLLNDEGELWLSGDKIKGPSKVAAMLMVSFGFKKAVVKELTLGESLIVATK